LNNRQWNARVPFWFFYLAGEIGILEEQPLLAQSGRSYANEISWSITNEQEAIQFPTGKEIAKPCQFRRGQGARALQLVGHHGAVTSTASTI
jgi:hypothetical protein